MTLLDDLAARIGAAHVLTGADAAPWARDWTGAYEGQPLAVLRPASTAEVAACLAVAHATGTPVVPSGGRTGLTGATHAPGQLVLSLDRMRRIRSLNPTTRVAVVEAGVVLATLHDAAEAEGLLFPLTFGARGSATIGGALSTNAGGSNVLRYGSARDLCLGIEAVTADGRVLGLLAELHKDNSGYALRHLLIGAEGTLAVITAAAMRLVPRPRAHVTAMVALPSLAAALRLLDRAREATGGAVEAFEWMPRGYMEAHVAHKGGREPFAQAYEVNVMMEVGATAPEDATPGEGGEVPATARIERLLADMIESGEVLDAHVARSEAERRRMWERREAAAELTFLRRPFVDTDVALPLDRVGTFLDRMRARLRELDPGAGDFVVAHLGDGNVHYTAYPTRDDRALLLAVRAAVDETAASLGGSFSAEHGIGLSKLPAMRALKDPVAVDLMRAVKAALDPKGILNPGKTVPGAAPGAPA